MGNILRVEHQHVQVGGVKLHWAIKGDGPSMILLHGFPEFWYCWKNQIPEFASKFRVVAPDMRGYNLSDKPSEVSQYKMHFLVEDVMGLIRALGERKVILVGHDWGGIVAWAFALKFPEFLSSLVILNAPHPAIFARELNRNPEQQRASQYILLFRSQRAEEVLTRNNYDFLKNVVFKNCKDPAGFTEEDKKAYLEAWSQPGAITGSLNYYRASSLLKTSPDGKSLVGEDVKLGDKKIQVPTLVIWGEQDFALTLGLLQGLDLCVEQLRVRRIPDATHWVHHDAPHLVNQYIRDFLSEQGI